jgi:NADPH2:quinone reductase
MRAYVVNEWVHPSQLKLVNDAPEPKTTGDQILVDVYSSALNFFDVRYHCLPIFARCFLIF